jgi:hypothetical protein
MAAKKRIGRKKQVRRGHLFAAYALFAAISLIVFSRRGDA